MSILARPLLALLLVLTGAAAWAQSEYRLRPGDTLNVEVLEDPSLNRDVVVLPDGRFTFPLAGSVPAAGRTVDQVRASVTQALSGNFATAPNVFIGVRPAPATPPAPVAAARARTISVYLMGEVQKSGAIEVKPGTTFLQALSQAGGVTPFAATARIQLRRTDPRTNVQNVYPINYRALMDGARMPREIQLMEGDVILVPERRLFE